MSPTLYRLLGTAQMLNRQLNQIRYKENRPYVPVTGTHPIGTSEAHLWTPEEMQHAEMLAERSRQVRESPQTDQGEYLHIRGRGPAEQYSDDPVGRKIKKIMHEGIRGHPASQKQAEAVALSMQRRGELPKNSRYADDPRKVRARVGNASVIQQHTFGTPTRAKLKYPAFQATPGAPVVGRPRPVPRDQHGQPHPSYARYAGYAEEPGPHNTFHYPTEIEPVDIGHPNVGQAFGHGLQARDMNRHSNNPEIREQVKRHAGAAKRFRNAGDTFGLQLQTSASKRKVRRQAGQTPHFGDYYSAEPPMEYGHTARCAQCGQAWYIAEDSVDLICPRCGASATEYAITDQPGIYEDHPYSQVGSLHEEEANLPLQHQPPHTAQPQRPRMQQTHNPPRNAHSQVGSLHEEETLRGYSRYSAEHPIHHRLQRLREALAGLKRPTQYLEAEGKVNVSPQDVASIAPMFLSRGQHYDDMDLSYADNIAGFGQPEGYMGGIHDPNVEMNHGHYSNYGYPAAYHEFSEARREQ